MNTKLTGIINPGDTQEIKDWIEKQVGSLADRNTDIADIKREITVIRQIVEAMHTKIDTIEQILEKVSD